MVHDDYKEMIPARALSALDAAEEQALNEHLEKCAECRKELEDWQATAAALSLTPDPVEPSPQVRERILSEVRKEASSKVIPIRSSSKRNLWSSFGSLGAIAATVLAAIQFWPDLWQVAIVVGIMLAGQALESGILTPNIIGSEIELHPVWLIFALLTFSYLFGFLGLLVAVPVSAAIGVLVRFALRTYLESSVYQGSESAKG